MKLIRAVAVADRCRRYFTPGEAYPVEEVVPGVMMIRDNREGTRLVLGLRDSPLLGGIGYHWEVCQELPTEPCPFCNTTPITPSCSTCPMQATNPSEWDRLSRYIKAALDRYYIQGYLNRRRL